MRFHRLFPGAALTAALLTSLSAQTNPNATGSRITFGPEGSPPLQGAYQTFVIPADQQQGIPLGANGNNAALFGNPGAPESSLPWFCRIQRTDIFIPTGFTPPGSFSYGAGQNPVVAYGEAGGGSPLYTDREYRFGFYAGARDVSLPGQFRLRAYQKSQFSGTATGVIPTGTLTFELPWPGDANWDAFLAAGSKKLVEFHGLKMWIEIVGTGAAASQWHGYNHPYAVTCRSSDPGYHFVLDYKGWAAVNLPMASSSFPPAVGNATFRPVWSMDFTARPTWRSTYLDAPHFTGKAAPSDYVGMSDEELSGIGGFNPPVPAPAFQTSTTLDNTPELRQHPKLDKLVENLGNDPVAIANYVFNEIKLVDPIAYSEDGSTDPKGIWAGGMNRNAFGTYLEGGGNPWEQCALLVYMMRKAGYPAVYVEPYKDNLFMLDTQLEKILRMRIKGAVDSEGEATMPVEVPVHYPWVAVWLQSESRWVHLFPWIKDTSVVEGSNLYEKFPDNCKSGVDWLVKYLKGEPEVLTDQVAAYLAQSAGDIVVEAEGFNENVASSETLKNTNLGIDQWVLKVDESPAGYKGEGWMQAVGNNGSVSDFNTVATAPRLEYVVDLPSAGTYYIWIRGNAGSSWDKCHVSMNGAALGIADLQTNTGWQWTNTNTGSQRISFTATAAGRHTLAIGVNKAGFRFDRLLLTQNASLTPTGEGSETSKQSLVKPNVPSYQFINYAKNQLAAGGASLADVGMKYLDRRRNRASLDEFPRPYRLNSAAHTIYTKLSDRTGTFDTVRVFIKKDDMSHHPEYANPNVKLDTGEWLSMDLHSRAFYVCTRKIGDGAFRLRFVLAPFRDSATGTADFFDPNNRVSEQVMTVNFDYIPSGNPTYTFFNRPNYEMEVTHVRQSRYLHGNVASVSVTNQGSGYTSAPTVTIAPPPNLAQNGTFRTATAQAVVSGGKVAAINIIDPGYGYDFDAAPPAVTFAGGGGSGVTATSVLSTPTQHRVINPDGTWVHPLGIESRQTVINRPTISEGDMGALCLNFGSVSQRMVDHLAENYWKLERQMKATPSNTSNIDFREKTQAYSAYLMGMDYYRRVSEFRDENARLHKNQVLSMYAAGLSKLQAFRSTYVYRFVTFVDSLSADGPFYYSKPSVDMFFSNAAWTHSGAVHTDSGVPFDTNTRDMWQIFTAEMSAQEHQVINDYYREDAAISTVRLLQRAQSMQTRVSPNTGVIKLTKKNYVAEGNKSYTRGVVTKALKNWNPSIWNAIVSVFTSSTGDYAEVYITPGNVGSASLAYNGTGAMVLSKGVYSALIGGSSGFYNGGFGSAFHVPRYEPSYLYNNTLTLGAGGYSLNYKSSTSAEFYVAPSAVATWELPTSYSNLNSGTYKPSSYQSYAWGQQASNYGLSGSLSNNYKVTESRGAMGSPSFFGSSVGGFFGMIESASGFLGGAISNISPTLGGWVSDPVDVVSGDFYLDAVDLTLPGPMPLALRRNYSSQSVSDSEFGHGWKSSIVPYVGVSDDGLLYAAEPDGSVIAYRETSSGSNQFVPTTADNPSLKNINEAGAGSSSNPMNNRIVKGLDGTKVIYTLSGPNGNVRRFGVRSFPVGSGANLITRERPYLEWWKDAQGNRLIFTYNDVSTEPEYGQLAKISANNGNSLGFVYDVYGHITEAWTQDGRRVRYEYDLQGDLVKVILPNGAEHQYEYGQETTVAGGESVLTSTHLLIRETKPEGRVLENDYDDQRRVTHQRAIVGNGPVPVQNAEFIYSNTQNTTTKTWTGTTTVKDAYGRPTVYTYTESLITSEDDPETPAEVREWYGATETGNGAYPRSIKKITDRRGVVMMFKYNSRGNVVEKSLGTDTNPADIDGDGVASTGEKAVTSWTHNSNDLPETQTDPSGMVTKWFYDDTDYPYLASRTEKWVGTTLVSKTLRQFGERIGAQRSAKGLVESEKTAEGTADEAMVEWDYDDRGFAITKTSHTGTTDPDTVVHLKHNLRGELIEEKQLATGGYPDQKWTYSYDAMGKRILAERSAGTLRSIDQTHYTLNGDVEWVDGHRTGVNDRVLYRYDKHGRQTEKLQWLSAALQDGSGVGTPPGDETVATTFYSYDLFNNLTEIKTPRRHSVAMEYDGIGRLEQIDYYSGYKGDGGLIKASRSFLYEPGGEISQHTDTLGGVTRLFYNARGQLRKRENPDGSVEEWRFYPDGRPFKEILRNGSYKELVYDDAARTVTETLKSSTGTVLKSAVSLYDRRGNLVSETKAGHTTVTTYDDLNRVKSVTGPGATAQSAQRIDIYSYPDALGRQSRVTNALNETTVIFKDALGRTEAVEVRDGNDILVSKTTHAYSADHNKVTTTAGVGAEAIVTETWTDTMGNTVLVKRADGTFTATLFEAGEVPTLERNGAGQFTRRTFDWQGAVTSEIRPGNLSVTLVNNAAGNLIERHMPGGLVAKSGFDSAGRPSWSRLEQGAAITRQFDYTYYPTGHAWAGMLESTTDARGIVSTYTYDAHLRVDTVTSTGADPEDALTRSHAYDELDHLVTLTETGMNGTTVVGRPRNHAGDVLDETITVDGNAQSIVSQKFNSAGRRFERSTADFVQSFGHRADGLMTSTTVGSRVYSSGFTTAGLFSSRSGPFQSQLIGYDNLGRMDSRSSTVGGVAALVESTPASGGSPGWSPVDKINRLQITRSGGGSWSELREFQYDASYRLTVESYLPNPGAPSNDGDLFFYDSTTHNTTGGPGVMIGRKRTSDGLEWKNSPVPGTGSFARITDTTYRGIPRVVPLSGVAYGAQKVELEIDGRQIYPVDFPGWQDPVGAWSASVPLPEGVHNLTARAVHPSGWVAPAAASQFTLAPRVETLTVAHDEVGNVISRSWSGGPSQTLTWDPVGRLVKVVQTGVNPFTWTALYDGLNRRIRTAYTPQGGNTVIIRQVYDPNVEFLCIGEGVSTGSSPTGWSWKAYGIDKSGTFGGLEGLGGLEAVRDASGKWRGIVSDWWGNTTGWVEKDGAAISWSTAQFGAFGGLAGWNTAVQDGSAPLHQLLGYRGLTTDPPGFLQMGLRPQRRHLACARSARTCRLHFTLRLLRQRSNQHRRSGRAIRQIRFAERLHIPDRLLGSLRPQRFPDLDQLHLERGGPAPFPPARFVPELGASGECAEMVR
jgi:YD repeat-containing protein